MSRTWFVMGAGLAALAVAAGAFGAHGLKSRLTPQLLEVWEMAARYQLFHALGLMLAALAVERFSAAPGPLGGWLLGIGIVIFSGSLYALALSGIRALGAVTPIGGVLLIAGWICLAVGAARS